MSKPIIYLDMDQVMVDWFSAVWKLFGREWRHYFHFAQLHPEMSVHERT